jgi:hypothetical protein
MRTGARKGFLALFVATAVSAFAPLGAPAQQGNPAEPYDGHLPFNCQLQDVATGTDFPHPESDPFCVEFDKTEQNVTDLGVLDFASKEPARVTAAGPKCFYFQRDHWTGSIVQGGDTETYHFDGSYFYDEASGTGGVHIDNFRLGGQPADSSQFVPPEYKQYFGKGGGGAYFANNSQVRPDCVAKVDTAQKQKQVYAHDLDAGPIFRKRITPLAFGSARSAILGEEGLPYLSDQGTDRFTVTGGGQLRVAYRGSGDSATVAALLTTAPKDARGAVHPGDPARPARKALHARRRFGLGEFKVFEAPRRKRSRLFLATENGKVSWIAVVDPTQIRGRKRVKATLRGLAFGPTTRVDSAGIPY